MRFEAIIFDFDGVVADSEYIANVVAADLATELGYSITTEDALRLFVGKRSSEVREIIERETGKAHPEFEATLLSQTLAAFERELTPVRGVTDYIERYAQVRRCIASSSSHARLRASLRKIGLAELFGDRVFSADDVARGKPFPDLFLHAARQLGAAPSQVLVIEDSAAGIKAAKAAGMYAVGLMAGAHVRPSLSDSLRAAGADFLASDYEDLNRLLRH